MELIFVYNVDSGFLNSIRDLLHKSVSPKTYGCNLCGLTYSGISQKEEWKTFIKKLPFEVEFLHKDEFREKYPSYYTMTFYPAVFKREDDALEEFISTDEIHKQKTLSDLESLILEKLK